MSELDNSKIGEMSTDKLIELEQKMSDAYYEMDVEYCGTEQTFSLTDYAEIIRELTLREEHKK